MSDESPRTFRVYHSGVVGDQLRAAAHAAGAFDLKDALLADARVIESALLWFADEFGESRHHAGKIGQARFAQIGRLAVWFAVSVERWEVTIGSFRFVPPRS